MQLSSRTLHLGSILIAVIATLAVSTLVSTRETARAQAVDKEAVAKKALSKLPQSFSRKHLPEVMDAFFEATKKTAKGNVSSDVWLYQVTLAKRLRATNVKTLQKYFEKEVFKKERIEKLLKAKDYGRLEFDLKFARRMQLEDLHELVEPIFDSPMVAVAYYYCLSIENRRWEKAYLEALSTMDQRSAKFLGSTTAMVTASISTNVTGELLKIFKKDEEAPFKHRPWVKTMFERRFGHSLSEEQLLDKREFEKLQKIYENRSKTHKVKGIDYCCDTAFDLYDSSVTDVGDNVDLTTSDVRLVFPKFNPVKHHKITLRFLPSGDDARITVDAGNDLDSFTPRWYVLEGVPRWEHLWSNANPDIVQSKQGKWLELSFEFTKQKEKEWATMIRVDNGTLVSSEPLDGDLNYIDISVSGNVIMSTVDYESKNIK